MQCVGLRTGLRGSFQSICMCSYHKLVMPLLYLRVVEPEQRLEQRVGLLDGLYLGCSL